MANESSKSTEQARHSFAALLEADRVSILDAYMESLDAAGSPVIRDPAARLQALQHANQTITDIVRSLRTGRVQIDENALLSREIGATRAAAAIPTHDSWSAAILFTETVMRAVIEHVEADELDLLVLVLLTLNQSITVRIREATGAYSRYLLSRIHDAHVAERRRLARELHDRIGNGLSVAHHQLELFHDDRHMEPVRALTRAERAHQAIVETMHSLRTVINDLRLEEPLKSLEKALANYFDTVQTETVDVRLRVHGDEIWIPPMVRDESFLILREAARNALVHGAPSVITISVHIAPHELRAVVEDDGRGFSEETMTKPGGSGLSAMRERAALLGGEVSVHSRPGRGTRVELTVLLPDHREDDEPGPGPLTDTGEDAEELKPPDDGPST